MTAWITLITAGLLEVGWAIGLKQSEGFSKLLPSTLTLIGAFSSFFLLSLALKHLPVGTAYSVWTGIGAVGTAAVAMLFLGEDVSLPKLAGIGLIVAGITVLNLVGGHG